VSSWLYCKWYCKWYRVVVEMMKRRGIRSAQLAVLQTVLHVVLPREDVAQLAAQYAGVVCPVGTCDRPSHLPPSHHSVPGIGRCIKRIRAD